MNSEEISGLDIEANQTINNVLNSSYRDDEQRYYFIDRDNICCWIFCVFFVGFIIFIVYEYTEKKIY